MAQTADTLVGTVIAGLRSLAGLVVVSTYILLAGPPGIALALLFKDATVLYWLGLVGVRLALSLTGIRFQVTGTEHIQRSRAAVYCVNHASNVEPPIIFVILRELFPRVRILYKAELHKIPILGRGFDVAGFVPVERGNREQSTWAIEQAAEALRQGHSFIIFPEGTRSRTGELLPFKKGGFIMAIKAAAPIVPIAISGAREAMRKGSPIVRPVTVTVTIDPPIETAGLDHADRDRVIAAVRERIGDMLRRQASARSRSGPSIAEPKWKRC